MGRVVCSSNRLILEKVVDNFLIVKFLFSFIRVASMEAFERKDFL